MLLGTFERASKEKILENEYQFQSFAERILELIKKFDEGLLTAKEMLEEEEKVTDDLNDEINSFKKSGLNKRAHGIYKILDAFKPIGINKTSCSCIR